MKNDSSQLRKAAAMLLVASSAMLPNWAAAGPSCVDMQVEMTRVSNMAEARQLLVERSERELDEVTRAAKQAFGDNLPTLAERNRLAGVAARELQALEPVVPPSERSEERKAEIARLTAEQQAAQKRSAQELAAAKAAGPDALAKFEATVREASEASGRKLKALYAEQQAEHDAAIADPVLYRFKKAQWRAAVTFTELEDRVQLLDSAKRAVKMYQDRLARLQQSSKDASCPAERPLN